MGICVLEWPGPKIKTENRSEMSPNEKAYTLPNQPKFDTGGAKGADNW